MHECVYLMMHLHVGYNKQFDGYIGASYILQL